MTSYKLTDDYIAYKAGEDGKRLPGMPAFEISDAGRAKIAPGEVYCRWVDDDGVMCPMNTIFSSESNLKLHVKRHRLEVKCHSLGNINMSTNSEARKFYKRLMTVVRGGDADEVVDEEPPAPPAISTPTKSTRPPRKKAKKAVVLLDPPTWTRKNVTRVSYSKLKGIAGMTGTCKSCKEIGSSCPPKVRRADCHVWAKFKVSPAENVASEGETSAAGAATVVVSDNETAGPVANTSDSEGVGETPNEIA